MKRIATTAVFVLAIAALLAVRGEAQDLQEQLKKLSRDAAIGYVTPLLNDFAAELNSGFYHSADLHDVLGFDIGVKVSIVRVKDENKLMRLTLPSTISVNARTFNPTYPNTPITFTAGVDYPSEVTTSTVFGPETTTPVRLSGNKSVSIAGYGTVNIPVNTTILELPGGLYDKAILPFAVPQVAVGLPLGLEVIGRYAPPLNVGEIGKFTYFGIGFRYDIDQWIPMLPIDIAAHFVTQKMTFKSKSDKDIFTAKGTAYGLEVSKKLLFITLYGGFQLEKATMSLGNYDYLDPATGSLITVQGFDVTGENKSRATVGVRFLLLILNVHAEYSFAKVPVATAGVGISLR